MADDPEALASARTNASLGSFTSGVDGSSEGGRIDTIRMPSALALYGVALVDSLKRAGYRERLDFRPDVVGGGWCLRLEYDGENPPPAPTRWHGHEVVVSRKPAESPGEVKR